MESKIYAFIGKNRAIIDVLDSTKGRIQVEFSGGDMYNKKAYTPAKTRPISDPLVQKLIEESEYFKKHQVFVFSTKVTAEEEVEAQPVVDVPEVTDFSTAVEYLKKNHGIKATQMRSPSGVKTIAKSLNIAFPNWVE